MEHKRQEIRAVARLARRPSGESDLDIAVDPITVGPEQTITIDLAKLPTPEKLYDADFAWIERRGGVVSLFFAKGYRDDPKKLRTRLELRYPPENLVANFWKNSRDFHESLRKYAAKWPKDASRDQINPAEMVATNEHSEWANFEGMAHAGTEASIDFYSLPAVGIARFARGQGSSGLRLTPIVRVQLTIFELLRLFESAEAAVRDIKTYLPKPEDTAPEPGRKELEDSHEQK